MKRATSLGLIGIAIVAGGFYSEADQAAEVGQRDCSALRSTSITHGSIAKAKLVPTGTYRPPVPDPSFAPPTDYAELPTFCNVSGVLSPTRDSHIGFELWLPAQGWNGHFLQVGNGGAAGSIVYSALAAGLQKGYAVTNTDTGHQGPGGDFAWAVGHPEQLTDFAYRAVHEVTLATRALTGVFYGKAPDKSFWSGCSTGGRQGLMEAQRFPQDYDAIVAGAPANNWGPLMALSIFVKQNVGVAGGLPVEKTKLLKEAALAQCDAADGVKDRVIADPARCQFNPTILACRGAETANCLTPKELAAANRVYAGVVGKSGKLFFPGTGVASEPTWEFYASPQFDIGGSFFRSLVAKDPRWNSKEFDADRDVVRLQKSSVAIEAMSPDISAFVAHGGKLLLYHGTIDGLIPYKNTESYYKSVVAQLSDSAKQHNLRFFTVPGMDHCSGGEGAFVVDWLDAVERWEQNDEAPNVLMGSRPPSTHAFTRPVCAYPQVARFRGVGTADDAANWTCSTTQHKPQTL